MAGDDAALVKRLERFNTPGDILSSYRALEQRVSSGELKSNAPFPVKGTPEEQSKWRAENGIPEAADKYELSLRQGVVLGDEDKAVVDEFLKVMHGHNMPPGLASETVQWYLDTVEKQHEAQFEKDKQLKQTFEDTMRAEWGNDYRANLNSIKSVLDLGGEGLFDAVSQARMADGTPFGSSPQVMKWLALMGRQINPVSTPVLGDGANIVEAVSSEIAKIEKYMRTNRADYNKDVKMQERLQQLYEYRDRGKNPAAAAG